MIERSSIDPKNFKLPILDIEIKHSRLTISTKVPISEVLCFEFWDQAPDEDKEIRIYIRVEFNRKKCKTAILLYCFHTAGVLHIFALYNLLGPGTSFYRKSKINIKRKPNYEIGWFNN